MMTPLVISIAAGVSIGLSEVATGLVTEAIKVSVLEPAVGGIQGWLKDKRLARQRDAQMQVAIGKALTAVAGEMPDDQLDQFLVNRGFSTMAGENKGLRVEVARAALLQTRPEANLVPDNLVDGLNFPPSNRPLLARFLYELRRNLLEQEAWRPLIEQANQEAVRSYLHGIAHAAVRTADAAETLARYKRMELQHFGLDPDQDAGKALESYIDWMNREYQHISFVLTRASQRERLKDEAELERVFVPLRVYETFSENLIQENDLGRSVFTPPDKPGRYIVREARVRGDEFEMYGSRELLVEDVLKEFPVFLLRGAPGSGKTTLLRHMTYCFSSGMGAKSLKWEADPLLPVMVPLRNFGRFLEKNSDKYTTPGGRAVREFIDDYFGSIDRISLPPFFFRDRLKQGCCLVLLDGLDEVGDFEQRAAVATYVKQFVDEYEPLGNRFVIASRPKGYDEVSDYFGGLQIAECDVLDLTPKDRDKLVQNLLMELEEDEGIRKEDEGKLLSEIGKSDRVDELSRNPLFCTTLVLVYKFHGRELPERRVDLYGDLVSLMLERWETHKATDQKLADGTDLVMQDGTGRVFRKKTDASEAKERALTHIAWWMQNEGKTEVPQTETQAELSSYFYEEEGADEDEKEDWATNFLDMAHQRSGIFVEYDTETYAFSHKHFLEYLAASALIGETDGDLIRHILNHAGKQLWDEVIKLAIAHEGLPTKRRKMVVEKMLEAEHLLLAGEGVRDAGSRAPGPVRTEIMRLLQVQMQDMEVEATARFEAGLLLDSFGWLPEDINDWKQCGAIGEDKRDLMVATYPVTNVQYGLFLADGGMDLIDLPEGVELDETEPRYWRDTTIGRERHGFPVVGISWYEAVAYTKWLSALLERLHGGEVLEPDHAALVADLAAVGCREVRLPTHAEWQAAAGGGGNERYPWDVGLNVTKGKDEVVKRANVRESGIGRTSPVGMYVDGASADFGVMDMSGNVLEWLADWSDEKQTRRVLAGGSWDFFHNNARVSGRDGVHPHLRLDVFGFRCVSPVF